MTLRVRAGPREDWFADGALDVLCGAEYTVTPASDRTGLRLDGPALTRARAGELPSEGMVTGALQVPPDGQPILLLADHGVTGGYPVHRGGGRLLTSAGRRSCGRAGGQVHGSVVSG